MQRSTISLEPQPEGGVFEDSWLGRLDRYLSSWSAVHGYSNAVIRELILHTHGEYYDTYDKPTSVAALVREEHGWCLVLWLAAVELWVHIGPTGSVVGGIYLLWPYEPSEIHSRVSC